MLGGVPLIFREGRVKNKGKWTKSREFPCNARGEVGNSRPEFWQIPLVSIFRHSITILLHY